MSYHSLLFTPTLLNLLLRFINSSTSISKNGAVTYHFVACKNFISGRLHYKVRTKSKINAPTTSSLARIEETWNRYCHGVQKMVDEWHICINYLSV